MQNVEYVLCARIDMPLSLILPITEDTEIDSVVRSVIIRANCSQRRP